MSIRADNFGWDDICKITVTGKGEKRLIEDFGQYKLEDLKQTASKLHGNSNKDRNQQNTHMMYLCLMASVHKDLLNQVLNSTLDITVNNEYDGPMLFKAIIMKIQVDTNSTVSHIRENLHTLDAYMTTVNGNILKFNQYVESQVKALECRGQTSTDLFICILAGYRACSDKSFVEYVELKNHMYEEGNEDMTPEM